MTPNLEHARVLLVDDRSPVLADSVPCLRSAFEVTLVSRPKEALKLLERERFDAVVANYQPSTVNALHVLRQARARTPEAIRVLVSDVTLDELGADLDACLIAHLLRGSAAVSGLRRILAEAMLNRPD